MDNDAFLLEVLIRLGVTLDMPLYRATRSAQRALETYPQQTAEHAKGIVEYIFEDARVVL